MTDTTEDLPYTTEDYKKYLYAKAQCQSWRMHEILDAVDIDQDSREDLDYRLGALMGLCSRRRLWTPAHTSRRRDAKKPSGRNVRPNTRHGWPNNEPSRPGRRRRNRDCGSGWPTALPRLPAPPPPPFDPVAFRANLGMDHNLYSHRKVPVTTTLRFGDAEDDYVMHVWHPDPDHPDNQPRASHEFCRGPGDGYPWRCGMLEVTTPGSIRLVYPDENVEPDESDLDDDQRRVLEALRERNRKHLTPSHRDDYHLALDLDIPEERVAAAGAVLHERGLIVSPLIYLTEDQQRVLNLLPNEYDCDPEDRSTWGPTDGQIAEQLGMTLGEVKEHLRALDNQGWVCRHAHGDGRAQSTEEEPMNRPQRTDE